MSQTIINIAQQETVEAIKSDTNSIKSEIGSTSATTGSATTGSMYSKLNKLITDLTSHITSWTSTRAGYIDNIKTNTDNIYAKVNNTGGNYTVTPSDSVIKSENISISSVYNTYNGSKGTYYGNATNITSAYFQYPGRYRFNLTFNATGHTNVSAWGSRLYPIIKIEAIVYSATGPYSNITTYQYSSPIGETTSVVSFSSTSKSLDFQVNAGDYVVFRFYSGYYFNQSGGVASTYTPTITFNTTKYSINGTKNLVDSFIV